MANKVKISDWIERGNEDQFKWAENYLKKRGLYTSTFIGETKYEQLANYLEDLAQKNNGLYYLSKMKGTWSVRKTRRKNGRKSYSFQLKPSTYEALQKLAKNATIYGTLEDLITDADAFKCTLLDEYNTKIKNKITALEKEFGRKPRKNKFKKSTLEWVMLETQLQEARDATQQTQVEHDKLLQELCQYVVMIKDAGIKTNSISMAQKAAATELFESVRTISQSELATLLGSQPQLDLDLE